MFKFIDIPQEDLNKIYEISDQASANNARNLSIQVSEKNTLAFPHETFTVGLSSLLKEDQFDPKKTGIRVIQASSTSFKSIVDVNNGVSGPQPQLFQDKKFISDYEKAFANIMDSEMEEKNYTVRTLRIPALYVDALWLHDSENKENDRYLPVRSENLFEGRKFYSKEEFFKILRNAAKNYDLNDELLGG